MLDYAEFGVRESDHGFLLLERDLDDYRWSPTFYDAFSIADVSSQVAVGADFGGLLTLEGFEQSVRPVVRPELVVEITTYWTAPSFLEEEYRMVFFFWDEDRRLVRIQPEEHVARWYPTWLWEPGQSVKVSLPALPVGDLPHVGVALLRPGVENSDVQGRVAPIRSVAGKPLSLWEDNTILELVKP